MENDVIQRKRYSDKIKPFIGKQVIKVLTGQRRVGKSYVLKQIIKQIKRLDKNANIIYIDKEDLLFDFIKTAEDLNKYIKSRTTDKSKNYVFIDEIQEINKFEKAMRSLLKNPVYDLYCTGSNANFLSSELSTFLSGRYIEIPVHSLSFMEFCEFHNLQSDKNTLFKYLKFGGMPYLRHLELEDEIVYQYLKGVYSTVIYKDVIAKNKIRNTAFLENLVLFLADNTGQLFSAKKISDYLKSQKVSIATSQVIDYLNKLANAFFIHRVKRESIVGKKVFEIGEKFYFEDIGLRNAIFEYKQTDTHKIMENAVYNHLLYCGYEVSIGCDGDREIDFVARKSGEKIYVQVCYLLHDNKTIEREFGNLERIKDNYPKFVVSMDEFSGNSRNGIKHFHLLKFLGVHSQI
ncbi:MAG: ATP-binding protein [Fibromonadaceae bacterium]|jgi:predicted AAA+ superfamily ATPase|nr:ATP-binding protein [Fibromonadaceae bacterium]